MSSFTLAKNPPKELPVRANWCTPPADCTWSHRNAEERDKAFNAVVVTSGGWFIGTPLLAPYNATEERPRFGTLCHFVANADVTAEKISVVGDRRIRFELTTSHDGVQMATWTALREGSAPADAAERIQSLLMLFDEWQLTKSVSDRRRSVIANAADKPSVFAWELGSELSFDTRSDLLFAADVSARLTIIEAALRDDLAKDPDHALIARVRELPLPPPVRTTVTAEIARFRQAGQNSSERGNILSFLQTLTELPWEGTVEPPPHDLASARAILDSEHTGLEAVKLHVLDQVASLLWWKRLRDGAAAHAGANGSGVRTTRRKRNVAAAETSAAAGESGADHVAATPIESAAEPPALHHILLVGPPGVGKTTILASIAAAMGRTLEIISCGGISDITGLAGDERHYVGARMGAIMEAVRRAGTLNLLLGLDEIDKMGRTHSIRGNAFAPLLEITDPAQNNRFVDRYLAVPFDLSKLMIVATANSTDQVPRALLDRFEVVDLRGYSRTEKLGIAERHLLPRIYQRLSLTAEQASFGDGGLATVVDEYTAESGVRSFERRLTTLMQRAIGDLLDSAGAVSLDAAAVRRYLGRPTEHIHHVRLGGGPGFATVLTVRPSIGAGMVLGAQASLVPGKGGVRVTGTVDDEITETAQVALSYVTLNADRMGIDRSVLETHDIHVHLDLIGLHKSGPSAGVAIAAAIVSALRGIPLIDGVTMTGEITLDGRVLAVGGVPEKVVSAHREGARIVVIPEANAGDIDEVPPDVRDAVTVITVSSLEEALGHVMTEHRAVVSVPEPADHSVDEPAGVAAEGDDTATREATTSPRRASRRRA